MKPVSWARLADLAQRLYNEFGISFYDEDGNAKYSELQHLVNVVDEATKKEDKNEIPTH